MDDARTLFDASSLTGSGGSPDKLVDSSGRTVTYVRLSITDRCDMRCQYCMAEKMTFLPHSEVLTLEEMARVASVFITKGVRKIRITGGEPLVRHNAIWLFEELGRHVRSGALNELCMTTNGARLAGVADDLKRAGLSRLNLSLDSLDPVRFKEITRVGDFDAVMEGARAAAEAGLPVKINTVALRGINDDQVHDLVAWCGSMGFDLTFIESMPLGDISGGREATFLPLTEVRQNLEKHWTLEDSDHNTGGPSRYVYNRDTGRHIGFITPLSNHFCDTCNRVRVTCTGHLYTCLGHEDGADLRAPLRAGADDAELLGAINHALANKPRGHEFVIDDEQGPALTRHMSHTGG